MPWHVAKSGECAPSHPWAVIKDADGTVEGCHATEEMAQRHMAAMYANEPKGGEMGNRSWYRIDNKADLAEVWLYDEVGKFGITAAEFVNDLNGIKAPTIDVRVNSPGGEVFDGMAIYSAIRNHPAKVTVHIDGLAASAASFIAMAGDHIKAERTATLMIHDGMAVVAGNSKDLTAAVALLDKCSDNIASIYAERAGGSVEDWRERMRAETWYTAAEAKAAGLVDEVVTGKARITNSIAWDLSPFRYPGRDKAPDPVLNHTPPEAPPEVPADDPPDEAGFLMPDIRDLLREDVDFDPDTFRAAVTLVAYDAPAPDRPSPPPVVEPVGESPPAVEFTAPDVAEVDPHLLRATIALVVNDAPAPDPPRKPAPAPPEPELSITVPDLRRAIREGLL